MIGLINNFLEIKDDAISFYDLHKANILNKISGFAIMISILLSTSNLILQRYPQLIIIVFFMSFVFVATILLQKYRRYSLARNYFCLIQLPLIIAACIYNVSTGAYVNTENLFLILAAIFVIIFDKELKFLFYVITVASFFSIRFYEYYARGISLDDMFYISSTIYLVVFMSIYYFINSYMNAFLKVCQDQKLFINQIEVQKSRLEKNNRTKNKLFSMVSHDLRNPLHMLTGLLQLEEELPEQELVEHRKKIKEKVVRINALMETVLAWAKSQLEGFEVDIQNVSINRLIETESALLEKLALQKNIILNVEMSGELNIQSDPSHLTMVIKNILNACLIYTSNNGSIQILVIDYKYHFEIIAKDSSNGLKRETIEEILRNKFSSSITGNFEETELGLALCVDTLKKIGGSLSIKSERGQGNQFILELYKNYSHTQKSGDHEAQIGA
ncbi:sensor histidine kinase [Ekhidna sp. To15]|uniref:sensor histidine kinase n=1 Tax=Ekhidna sp. To15 TaxID=3395267 RepID=UPI003F528C2A